MAIVPDQLLFKGFHLYITKALNLNCMKLVLDLSLCLNPTIVYYFLRKYYFSVGCATNTIAKNSDHNFHVHIKVIKLWLRIGS